MAGRESVSSMDAELDVTPGQLTGAETKQWLDERLAQLSSGNLREFKKMRMVVLEEENLEGAKAQVKDDPYLAYMRSKFTMELIKTSFVRFYGAPISCHFWEEPDERKWQEPFMVAYDADSMEVLVPEDVMRWNVDGLEASLESLIEQYGHETTHSMPELRGQWLLLIKPCAMMSSARTPENADVPCAFVEGTIVGFAAMDADNHDMLAHIWVAATMRKQGCAKQLVQRAHRDLGLKRVAGRYSENEPLVQKLREYIK